MAHMWKRFCTALDLEKILLGVIGGLVAGLIFIIMAISWAALIFSGPLSGYLANGIGFFLFSTIILSAVLSFFGSIPGTAICAQDVLAIVIAIAVAKIARELEGSSGHVIFATVVMAIILSSLSMGLIFFLIGLFKLGNLVRYIPYPVMGGFLSGTGVLLTLGAIEILLGKNLELGMLHTLIEAHILLRWLPSVVTAILVIAILNRFQHMLLWPTIIAVYIAIFYALLYITGTSIEEARTSGLLLKPFSQQRLWTPFLFSDFQQVNWSVLFMNLDKLAPVPLVGLITFLLNASGLELVTKRDIDLNHELRVTGLANILAAFGGGLPGYHSLGVSSLAFKMGAVTSVFTLTTGLFCVFILLVDSFFISYIPIALLSCLLMVVGFSFLYEWVYEAWFKLPFTEYLIVLTGLIVIPTAGFSTGLVLSILVATGLFVIKYSAVDAVRDVLNGTIYHAKVDRSVVERDLLRHYGSNIHILRLQGYIFFGTSSQLLSRIRESLVDKNKDELFILLDFHRVHGLDSSATSSFMRMVQLAEAKGSYLVFTHTGMLIRKQLELSGFCVSSQVMFFPTLDHGVEWCENRILKNAICSVEGPAIDIQCQLRESFPKPRLVEKLASYFERLEFEPNHYLIRAGELTDSMYFIESGQVDILIETSDGKVNRLRSVFRGTVVGELGIYFKQAQAANVVTIRKSVLHRLSRKAMEEMEVHDPDVSSALHEWMASLLAERMADSYRSLEALLD